MIPQPTPDRSIVIARRTRLPLLAANAHVAFPRGGGALVTAQNNEGATPSQLSAVYYGDLERNGEPAAEGVAFEIGQPSDSTNSRRTNVQHHVTMPIETPIEEAAIA